MKDAFTEMIDRPGFSERSDLVNMFIQQTNEELLGINLYRSTREDDSIFVVDGLSVAYEGITCVYFDMASGGRTTCNNPEPALHTPALTVVEAKKTGYKTRKIEPMGMQFDYHFLRRHYDYGYDYDLFRTLPVAKLALSAQI
jgi:hypothetical protein